MDKFRNYILGNNNHVMKIKYNTVKMDNYYSRS